MQVVTLKERKEREAMRRRSAVAEISASLREFATEKGGRFLIFGSAARDELRYDSDLDILFDFPDADRLDAWEFVESLAARYELPIDIIDFKYASDRFLERALRYSIEIS